MILSTCEKWCAGNTARRGALGHNGVVPTVLRPDMPPDVADAVSVLGYAARVAILGYLHEHGPATRGQLTAALGLGAKNTQFHLTALVELGALARDPALEDARRGQSVTYALVPARVAELHAALGKHIGAL